MDSEEDLPELEVVEDNNELPILQPVDSDDEEMPSLIPEESSLQPPAEPARELSEDDEMPALLSVSDSSEELDDDLEGISLFQGDSEGDDSEWEDEDDFDFDDDLPPLVSFLQSHRQGVGSSEGQGEDLTPPLIPVETATSSNPRPPFVEEPTWFPPRRHTRTRSIVDGVGQVSRQLLESIALALHSSVNHTEPDLERAKILVDGLERVSVGLLSRMIKVGGAPGTHEDLSEEDEGIAGCAVCWAPLLDKEASETKSSDNVLLPFPPEGGDETDIICLPCAHVFHSSCLLPWFSRKTTCPTCRFNIDPTSSTERPYWQSTTQSVGASQMHADTVEPLSAPTLDTLQAELFDAGGVTEALGNMSLGGGDLDGDLLELHWEVSDFDSLHEINSLGDGVQVGRNGWSSQTNRSQTPRTNRTWTVPDAPGKSLRERIEEKERDIGLRCLDATCIFGPTDDDPDVVTSSTMRQMPIHVEGEHMCKHMLHPACLVMSARVAGWKPISSVLADEHEKDHFSAVEVSCPSCRAVGSVSREVWEEGVAALAEDGL